MMISKLKKLMKIQEKCFMYERYEWWKCINLGYQESLDRYIQSKISDVDQASATGVQ